jgi:hypothetical protein
MAVQPLLSDATPDLQQQHQQQLQQQQYNDPQLQLYATPDEQEQESREGSFEPPKIQLKHVSMALRLTSEWNRRLSQGINQMKHWGKGRRLAFAQPPPQQEYPYGGYQEQQQRQEPYGDLPVNVHPSRTWQPPIPSTKPINIDGHDNQNEDLTIFHAKTPYQSSSLSSSSTNKTLTPRGVTYWGPDLLDYLHYIVDFLGVSSNGIEIPLAMIYMDRACSVETPRSNGILACPFCTPRTVHRLSLVALVLAVATTSSMEQLQVENLLQQFPNLLDIPEDELIQMVDWMRGALGDLGLMVTVDQMKQWSLYWESIFSGKQGNSNRLEQPYVPQTP